MDELDGPRVAQAGDPLEPAPNSSVSPGPMRPSPGPMRPSPSAADVTGVPAGPSHACTDGRRCRLRFGARVHVQRQRRLGGRPLFSSISQLIVSYSALHFMFSLGEIAEPVAHLRRCRGLDRKQDISSLASGRGLAVGCTWSSAVSSSVPTGRLGLENTSNDHFSAARSLPLILCCFLPSDTALTAGACAYVRIVRNRRLYRWMFSAGHDYSHDTYLKGIWRRVKRTDGSDPTTTP